MLYLKYEFFVFWNIFEKFKSVHDLPWQGQKNCLEKQKQNIILLTWLEVTIAVLQRLFNIRTII